LPTAAKAVSAILFGGLFYYLTTLSIVTFDDGVLPKWYYEVNVLIAAICGWRILGARAGRSYSYAISHSVTTLVAIVFWVLLSHGFSEMIKQSLRNQYDTVMDAIPGSFGNSLDLGKQLATSEILVTMVIATLVIAFVVEFTSRRWS
jgi:uncharacterized membrane protein YwzB